MKKVYSLFYGVCVEGKTKHYTEHFETEEDVRKKITQLYYDDFYNNRFMSGVHLMKKGGWVDWIDYIND